MVVRQKVHPGQRDNGLGHGEPGADGPLGGPRREGLEGVDGDGDVVVVVEAGAALLVGVVAAVDVEGDDDGGVPLGEVVARGGREARAGEGERVGDVVVPGGLAAEADEVAGGGERGGVSPRG